jgi:hypothetical protein
MFIIVPLIIIFLCLSYLYTNETTMIIDILIYGTILATIFTSLFLYKKVQNDLKQQELNSILIEINRIKELLQNSSDPKVIQSLNHKIEQLENEYQNYK